MSEFFAMGGHGGYVWSAYGITLLILTLNGWAAVRRHKQAINAARQAGAPANTARRPTVKEL